MKLQLEKHSLSNFSEERPYKKQRLDKSLSEKIIHISKREFEKQFKDVEDIEMDHFATFEQSHPIQTTGVATCLGIVAKSYSTEGELQRTGLMHFDASDTSPHEDLSLKEFLENMLKDKVARIWLYVAGGYRNNDFKESNYQSLIHTLETNKSKFSSIEIKDILLNPWNIDKPFDGYDRAIDYIGFSLSTGVDKNGRVFVCDTTAFGDEDSNSFYEFDINEVIDIEKRLID